MNCPKCNSPINDGDKFCQVCGNVINNPVPQEPAAVQPVAATPTVAEQPALNNMQQPTNQGMNYNPAPTPSVQPMGGGMPMNNQMSPIPQEPKKNNTLVIILSGLIVILIAVVVFLLISQGDTEKDDNGKSDPDTSTTEPTKEPVVTTKYTETTVNGYKFKLPEGYQAELYNNQVMLYNDDMSFEANVLSMDGSYNSINKEGAKVNFTANGITNVTYEDKTVNNKKMTIFKGIYQGYQIEYVYIDYSLSKVLGAAIVYETEYETVRDDIYDILTQVEIVESSFSSNANSKLPALTVKDALVQE